MTDFSDSGFPLYEKLVNKKGIQKADDNDADVRIVLLTQFKGHVKKELLHVPSIPSYFESLYYILDYSASSSVKLLILTHSSLCYLVKRVAMQLPTYFKDSEVTNELLLHLFFLRGDNDDYLQNKNLWASACRALEAIYLVQPLLLQKCLQRLLYGLESKRKILLVVDEFLQINKRNNASTDNDNLMTELFNSKFLQELSSTAKNEQNNQLTLDVLRRNFNHDDQLKIFSQQINEDSGSFSVPIFDIDYELGLIAEEYRIHENGYVKPEEVYHGRGFASMDDLYAHLEKLLIPFQSPKETEKNWKERQSNLLQLRDMIHGDDFIANNQLSFLSVCKDLQMIECIGKAVLSLRTTLSMTACQVIKAFLMKFQQTLDLAILDQIFSVLKSLLLTAKKISSNTAFNCLIIMFINIGFHNKLFQYCLMLVNEKSVTPRNCSAILLRIILIKYTDSKKLDPLTVYIEEWLKKGITDAQTSVRESMRLTFWYYYKCYPLNAKNFLNTQLSLQLRKAVELSIPHHIRINYNPVHMAPSSSSSSESLNKSSHHFKKFPSYAKPTQSSNAFLQRMANHRSASEYLPSDVDHSTNVRRKISAPPSSSGRRTINATTEKQASNVSNDLGNSIQIELTDDISNSHSNSLITKYLGKDQQVDDFELIYRDLNSHSLMTIKDGLQLLQKKLLTTKSSGNDEAIDVSKIVPALKTIMVKAPSDLKPFLAIPYFCRSIPVDYLLEIHAINGVDLNDHILQSTSETVFLETVTDLITRLRSNAFENDDYEDLPELSLYYMKYRQSIFNFCFRVLSVVLQRAENSIQPDTVIRCVISMTGVWGLEFEEEPYFDALGQLHFHNEDAFKEALGSIESVSTKLKICEGLTARNGGTMFNSDELIGRRHISSGAAHGNDRNEDVYNEDNDAVEDRKFLEMTMVNPFNQNRSASGGSVVHHEPNSEIEEKKEHFQEPRISEMTKVVSVYELPQQLSEPDQDGDVKMAEQPDVNLSEIFGNSIDQENGRVKFCSEPPKLINPSTGSSSAGASALITDSPRNEINLNKEASIERNKSPVTPLAEHEAKILSHGINSIDISVKRNKDQLLPSVSSEILNNAIHNDTSNEDHMSESEFLQLLSPETLTYYEISQLWEMHVAEDAGDHFKEMMKAIGRIKNRSFTIKHLNDLIVPLLAASHHNALRKWLENEDGYDELLTLSKLLLNSADETTLIPINMACKCIVLTECLILMNSQLSNVPSLASAAFHDIWDFVVDMVGKLSDYSNELYVLLQELRDLLNEAQFFSSKDITSIVSLLATQTQENGTRIKETFLIETLSLIISRNAEHIKEHQYSEIVQMMQFFFESDFSEWRSASAGVLANVLKQFKSTYSSDDAIRRLFGFLSHQQFQLITRIVSSSN